MEADDVFRAARPARPDAADVFRRSVVQFAQNAGIDGPVLDSIKLAVSEAVTNAVVHAFLGCDAPGTVSVEAWFVDARSFIVVVADDGRGMRPRHDSPGLGLGLPLITEVTDDLRVGNMRGGGTRVSMRFSLDGSGTSLTGDAG